MADSTFARSLLATGALCAVLAIATQAPAQEPDVRSQIPAGSIDSAEKADQALAATQTARSKSDAQFAAAQKACYKKILVNACIDSEKAARRDRDTRISSVELEAKRYKRTADADSSAKDRQDKADKKSAGADEDAARRSQDRLDYESHQQEAARKAEQRAKDAGEAPAHAASQNAREKDAANKKTSESKTAKTRAQQGAQATEDLRQKEIDADERRERLAKKHTVKEAERAQKAGDKAAKNANLPPPPPPQSALPTPVPLPPAAR